MILSSPVDVSVPTVSLTHTYPPVIKHGNWKSHKNTKLSIGNSSIFGIFQPCLVPPAHHPKDEDLNQANAWKRHRRSGAVESADKK